VNVTVCEFHDNGAALERDWEHLCAHPRAHRHVPLALMPRSTPASEFDRWLAGAGETAALAQRAQPFVTVELESAALQPSAG
jgi:hypothetical protein